MRRHVGRLLLAAEAALLLVGAGLAIRLLGPARTTKLLGRPAPPEASGERVPPTPGARRIGRAVERVARVLPWHPVCLPQALATRAMLRRRGIACESHLGMIESDPISAHAWVTVGGMVVQGGPVSHVTELAHFR